MPFSSKQLVALTFTATVLAPVAVGGQTISPTNAPESTGTAAPQNGGHPRATPQLTGKERLGEKWKDEQRIDNCKVPLDKRGVESLRACAVRLIPASVGSMAAPIPDKAWVIAWSVA